MLKVSIIIPVYNVEAYIERCISSVLNQTYDNIEIIIVDDSSPDNSIEIAKKLISKHRCANKVIFTKHHQNRGLSASRNTGINLSTGDYIYFLDSDDEITSECISILVNTANNSNRPDFVIGDIDIISNSNIPDLYLKMGSKYITNNEEILRLFVLSHWYVMAWNKLIKSTFLKKENLYFYEGIIHEDVLWSFLLANKAVSMASITNRTYKYYIRNNSLTTSPTQKNVESLYVIIKEIYLLINKGIVIKNKENLTFLLQYSKTLAIKSLEYKELTGMDFKKNMLLSKFSLSNLFKIRVYTIGDMLFLFSNILPSYLRSRFLFLIFIKIKNIKL